MWIYIYKTYTSYVWASKHIEFAFVLSRFSVFYVQKSVGYFSLSFHTINLRIPSCSARFMQDFLDHYMDRFRFNDVHVG